MTVEWITRREDLPALAEDWDRLALADPRDGFFRTAMWYRAWLEHIRPDVEPFVVVVRNAEGRIAGLAPLCRGAYSDLGFRLRGVFWAGRETVSSDFLDFLAEPEARGDVLSAILGALREMRSRWGVLVMGELLDGGPSYEAVERLARENAWPLRRQEERICPFIALPGSFDQYLASMGSSTRYHIRRRLRDFEKAGARVEAYSDQEILPHLDTLVRLHLARWRKDDQPGTLARPGFAAFLRQVCSAPPPGGRCRAYLLRHEGAVVACLLAFWFGQSALYYQAGWDPDSSLARQSPGVVVMAHSIRDAIEQGFTYYEFLRGDESYKGRWTKSYRTTSTVLLARSGAARMYLRVAALKDRVKPWLGRGKAPAAAEARQDDGEEAALHTVSK